MSSAQHQRPSQILIICGPTGSGKTALALRLAQNHPTSIISVDSRQVYRDLSIVTGKDIPEGFIDQGDFYSDGQTRIFGLDLLSAQESFSVGQFIDYVIPLIDKETKQGRRLIFVGGTGLYLKALTQPLDTLHLPHDLTLRQVLQSLPREALQDTLKKLNLEKFNSLNQSDVHNPRRLIRAIEIANQSKLVRQNSSPLDPADVITVGLRVPDLDSVDLIKARVVKRIESGAIEEVGDLIEKYPDTTLPIYSTLGVREIMLYLDGSISKIELVERWTLSERQYAKRQMTWLKKQSSILWYDYRETNQLIANLRSLI